MKSAASAVSVLAQKAVLAADQGLAPAGIDRRQAFWPPSLQMRAWATQNVCVAGQREKGTHGIQGLQGVCGPHRLWQIQSKRSLETRVLVSFRRVLEKTPLAIQPSGHLGDPFHGSAELEPSALAVLGGWGGRRPGRTVGSCAGRRNATFKAFWRLRVGKSSTRMANRCPRSFDAGGKGRDEVGC